MSCQAEAGHEGGVRSQFTTEPAPIYVGCGPPVVGTNEYDEHVRCVRWSVVANPYLWAFVARGRHDCDGEISAFVTFGLSDFLAASALLDFGRRLACFGLSKR